jgi:CheY-like chemotaxis protein
MIAVLTAADVSGPLTEPRSPIDYRIHPIAAFNETLISSGPPAACYQCRSAPAHLNAALRGQMGAIRIAIVDDSEIFRKCLRILLEKENDFEIVAEGESGLAALDIADLDRPDLMLMDINMPLMNGFAATRIISANFPETRVIMLSMHSDESMKDRASGVGAYSYLTKDCPSRGVLLAIRDAHTNRTQPPEPLPCPLQARPIRPF